MQIEGLEAWCRGSDLQSMLLLFCRAGLKPDWEWRHWLFFPFFFFLKGALPCKRAVSGNPVPFMLSFMNFSLSHFLRVHSVVRSLVVE